jgi:hypothetical protein
MNDPTHQEWHRLFNAALNGTLTAAERPQLAALLKSSAEARQLWYLYHDNECGLSELKHAAATTAARGARLASGGGPSPWQTSPWLQWRSLTAAAAGLVLGMFGASVVYGIAVHRGAEKRTPLAVFAPGFENAQMALVNGMPRGAGQWGGDPAQVVTSEHGVQPKEGRYMLQVGQSDKTAWRLCQVLDLQSLPPGGSGESREIEISASLALAGAETAVRFFLRAFAVTEAPEELDAAWLDRRDESIASATRGHDIPPGTQGWQTLGVSMQVPRTARSLVLFLGVRAPDKETRNSPMYLATRESPMYLDDVRVTLVTPSWPG